MTTNDAGLPSDPAEPSSRAADAVTGQAAQSRPAAAQAAASGTVSPPGPSGAAPADGSVAELQARLTQLGYTIPASEQGAATLGQGTKAALEQFQTAHGLPVTGAADAATAAALAAAVASSTYTVTGTVLSPALPGVGGLTVQLVDKNVGGDQVLATTQTASDGGYAFSQLISPTLPRRASQGPARPAGPGAWGPACSARPTVSYSAPARCPSTSCCLRARRACRASTRR